MPDSETVKRDVLDLVRKHYGHELKWIREVIGKVKFVQDDSIHNAAEYKDGTIRFKSECYAGKTFQPGALPQTVHEIWHAYWDLVAEEKATTLGTQVRDHFLHTEKTLHKKKDGARPKD